MSHSGRQSRRLQTSQLPAPSLLLTRSSLYPARTPESLPTITTLNPSSSSARYPTRSSAQKPASAVEDELHSESDDQQANTKQESGEGGSTSDFVKKLYRWVSGFDCQAFWV